MQNPDDIKNIQDGNSAEIGYSEKLSCSKSTKELIVENCISEFRRHHPELNGIYVTNNMILAHIANFYLKS